LHISPRKDEVAEINNKHLQLLEDGSTIVYKCTGSNTYAEGPKAGQKADDKDVPKKEEK
jgi:hypothetical protein